MRKHKHNACFQSEIILFAKNKISTKFLQKNTIKREENNSYFLLCDNKQRRKNKFCKAKKIVPNPPSPPSSFKNKERQKNHKQNSNSLFSVTSVNTSTYFKEYRNDDNFSIIIIDFLYLGEKRLKKNLFIHIT